MFFCFVLLFYFFKEGFEPVTKGLACSEWTQKPWVGESEGRGSQSSCRSTPTPQHAACVYRCTYVTRVHAVSRSETRETDARRTVHNILIPPPPHATPAVFSPLRPTSLDPTDSLQSALEPRGSSLPLEPVSETVHTESDGHSAPCCLGGPTKKRTESPLRTARTAAAVVLKGSLYRNALFMIVIIIIVMII